MFNLMVALFFLLKFVFATVLKRCHFHHLLNIFAASILSPSATRHSYTNIFLSIYFDFTFIDYA